MADPEPEPAEPVPGRRPLAVFDIDGVVADVRHRLHHLERRPKDWRSFFAGAAGDPPLPDGVELARHHAVDGELVWLTGRPDRLRRVTKRWLDGCGLPAGRLVMRAGRDFRPATVVKLEALEALADGRDVSVVVDDDPAVVAVLGAAGWPVRLADWVPREPVLREAQHTDGRT